MGPHSAMSVPAQKCSDPYPSRCADRPRILPRREPVVYSAWSEDAPLSREQTDFYHENGFLELTVGFTPRELVLLMSEVARLRDERSSLPADTVIDEPGSGALRSVFHLDRASDIFGRLLVDERLVRIAEFLLGDAVYVHQSRLNYKPGFRGKEFYWHSDFETWHVEDGMPQMRAVSMSIALSPNTALNGPLMLIPGSHRSFVACVGETPDEHYRSSLKKQEYGVPDEESLTALAADGGITAPIGHAGRVTIFDCNIMHGSNSNITPHARCNLFFVYNSVSNRLLAPFGGKSPRPEFLAARERIAPITVRRRRLL